MRRTLEQIGREALKQEKVLNREAAIAFRAGEAIQYYKDGWRYGHVVRIGERGRLAGMVQIEHQITGKHWIKAADVRALPPLKSLRASANRKRRAGQARPRVRRSSR